MGSLFTLVFKFFMHIFPNALPLKINQRVTIEEAPFEFS